MNTKSILFIIPYFGKWPEWIELYIDSLRRNPTVDFLFITDCEADFDFPVNVRIEKSSFEEYIKRYKNILGEDIQIPNPYKICDLRPFFALIHENEIQNYDFFGWCDVDLVFGDIRSFYSEEILNKYSVLSTHKIRLSGHCALLKNTAYHRNIGYRVYRWKEALKNPEFVGIDEHGITNALQMTIFDKAAEKFHFSTQLKILKFIRYFKIRRHYFKEQYTTPFISIPWIDGSIYDDQPDSWFYERGKIGNSRDKGVHFMYLHFMNFKSSTWRKDHSDAPWKSLSPIYMVTDVKSHVTIDILGIKNN